MKIKCRARHLDGRIAILIVTGDAPRKFDAESIFKPVANLVDCPSIIAVNGGRIGRDFDVAWEAILGRNRVKVDRNWFCGISGEVFDVFGELVFRIGFHRDYFLRFFRRVLMAVEMLEAEGWRYSFLA